MEKEGPKRSIICSICLSISRNYNLNYGAASCFGCRAFFRRVVQGNSAGNLMCVNPDPRGKECDVTKKDKKCRKCRWDKCIKFGMSVEKVMVKDDINHRFRKSLKRKKREEKLRAKEEAKEKRKIKRLAKQLVKRSEAKKITKLTKIEELKAIIESCGHTVKRKGETSIDLLLSEEEEELDEGDEETKVIDQDQNEQFMLSSGQEFKILLKSSKWIKIDVIPQKSSKVISGKKHKDSSRSIRSGKTSVKVKFRNLMKNYWNDLIDKWNKKLGKVYFEPDLINGLLGFYHRDLKMPQSFVKSHLLTIIKLFTDFALSQDFFSRLSIPIQRKLLIENSILLVQFLIAHGIQADSGYDQLRCWFCGHLPNYLEDILKTMQLHLEKKSLWQWDEFVELFGMERVILMEFQLKVDKLCLQSFCLKLVPFWAKACLLESVQHSQDTNKILTGEREEFYTFADWNHETFGHPSSQEVKTLLEGLTNMKSFFLANAQWRKKSIPVPVLNDYLPIEFVAEENLWFKNCIVNFHSIFSKVPAGQAYMQPIINQKNNLTLVPEDYSQYTGSLWAERFRRCLSEIVYKRSEEVGSFPQLLQLPSLSFNVFNVLTLCLARVESFDTRLEQARFYHGRDDIQVLEGPVHSTFSFRDIVALDPENCHIQAKTLSKLASQLKPILDHKDLFYLLFFFALCDNIEMVDGDKEKLGTLKIFKNMVTRRFAHSNNMYSFELNNFLDATKLISNASKKMNFVKALQVTEKV